MKFFTIDPPPPSDETTVAREGETLASFEFRQDCVGIRVTFENAGDALSRIGRVFEQLARSWHRETQDDYGLGS